MEKKNNVYVLESESDLTMSVQKTKPFTDKKILPEEITFVVENVRKRYLYDGSAVISISKAEAKELIKVLLDMI